MHYALERAAEPDWRFFQKGQGRDLQKSRKRFLYIYAKPALTDAKIVTEYVGRYPGRPVIATKRIDKYDSEKDTVTFHYNKHEDNSHVEKTIPALDFVSF